MVWPSLASRLSVGYLGREGRDMIYDIYGMEWIGLDWIRLDSVK